MSGFSPLEIFKSQAKQIARDQGLKLSDAQKMLAQKAGFEHYHELYAVSQRNPKDRRLMMAAFGVEDFRDAIYQDDVYSDLDLELERQLSGAMAETNAEEFTISDLRVLTKEYMGATGVLKLTVSLTYEGSQHPDRPYHGAAFHLQARIQLLRRKNTWRLAEEGLFILNSESDMDRDNRSEQEYWSMVGEARQANTKTLADALAIELGIAVEDAELLTGAEITPNQSDDGLVYSYLIDLEPEAEGKLRADLLARLGTLHYELPANFFDDVERDA